MHPTEKIAIYGAAVVLILSIVAGIISASQKHDRWVRDCQVQFEYSLQQCELLWSRGK